MEEKRYYQRFTIYQIVEHWVLTLDFTALALTGLPQMFSGYDWAKILVGLLGGIEMTRHIHHIFAVVMILGCLYHVMAAAYKKFALRTPFAMMPKLKDFTDLLQVIKYNLGLANDRPKFGRYSYEQKLEYWAVVWGSLIMIITGFMLWNPEFITRFLPGQFVPVAKVIHGGEALLAVLSIMTWHFYHVHIKHWNKAMFTGKITEEEMEEEHPLELEKTR